eukprot:8953560-Lingulodinium_polyedra.AAC.1
MARTTNFAATATSSLAKASTAPAAAAEDETARGGRRGVTTGRRQPQRPSRAVGFDCRAADGP